MKSFSNYFALEMILLNILQNVTIYLNVLFRILHLSLEMILLHILQKNEISFHEILFWCQIKSNSKETFEWLIVSSLQFVIFGTVKIDVCKTFAW